MVSILRASRLYTRWINSDGSETYANGCVTADGSVNHKRLSSRNHKPETGQGCLQDTPRHKTDKYNDQQPLTIRKPASRAQTAPRKTLGFRSAKNVTGDPKLGDTFVTAAVPASYFRSKSKQRRLPAFNDKRNHSQPQPPLPKKKIGCKKESLHIPFNKGVANLSEWLSNSLLLGVWRRGGGWWRGLEKPRCPPFRSVHFHKRSWLSHLDQKNLLG